MERSQFSKVKEALTTSLGNPTRRSRIRLSENSISSFQSKSISNVEQSMDEDKEQFYQEFEKLFKKSSLSHGDYKSDSFDELKEFTFSHKLPQKLNEQKNMHFKRIRQKVESPKKVQHQKAKKNQSLSLFNHIGQEGKNKSTLGDYYKNQLIKVKAENIRLVNRVNELEEILYLKAKELSFTADKIRDLEDKIKISEKETTTRWNSNEQRECLKEKVQRQAEKIVEVTSELQKWKERSCDYIETKNQNYELKETLNQLILKNAALYEKTYRFTPAVQHLWDIKEVEYANIIEKMKDINGKMEES